VVCDPVLRVGSTTAGAGGDGPLPGTAAGSSGGRDAEVGVVELSLLTLLVAEPSDVVPEPPLEDPLPAVGPLPPLTEVSEPEPEVAPVEEPVEVSDETVALPDVSLAVLTEPETVRVPDPELAAVLSDDASTVVVDGAVAIGAGTSEPEVVIGDAPPPLELLTSLGEPLDESASRRPFGESAETIKGVLASVASD
jgi:hypothetical protein